MSTVSMVYELSLWEFLSLIYITQVQDLSQLDVCVRDVTAPLWPYKSKQ